MSSKVRTAEMTWREVEERLKQGLPVIVPMGSTEEHGPHSPTGDFMITDVIAERVAQNAGALVTPTLAFSYSEYFRHYPGTITLQPETMRLLVKDTVYSLLDQGFKHVILFNGHKGNEPILFPLIREIRRERGLLVPFVAPLAFGLSGGVQKELYGDTPTGHGGEPIGSIMAHLFPEHFRADLAEDWASKPFLGQSPATLNGLSFEGNDVAMAINMEDVTPPSGSLSDPKVASADKGERIVENSVKNLSSFVNWFKTVDPTAAP